MIDQFIFIASLTTNHHTQHLIRIIKRRLAKLLVCHLPTSA